MSSCNGDVKLISDFSKKTNINNGQIFDINQYKKDAQNMSIVERKEKVLSDIIDIISDYKISFADFKDLVSELHSCTYTSRRIHQKHKKLSTTENQ